MSFSGIGEQEHPRVTPAVQWLIALNVAIYFLQLTIVRPADMAAALAFTVPDLTQRPWTIFTYMFVHASASRIPAVPCPPAGVVNRGSGRRWEAVRSRLPGGRVILPAGT